LSSSNLKLTIPHVMQWCGVWIPAPALFLQGSGSDSPGVVAFWEYWTGKYKTRPSGRSQEANQRCLHIPVRSKGFSQIKEKPTLWNLWRHVQRYAISCEYLNRMSEVQYMRMLYKLLKLSVIIDRKCYFIPEVMMTLWELLLSGMWRRVVCCISFHVSKKPPSKRVNYFPEYAVSLPRRQYYLISKEDGV